MLSKVKVIAFASVLVPVLYGLFGCPGGGVKIGLPPPPLNLERVGGGQIDLNDLKGQVVLVNFWAIWCAPCKTEMPVFERIHRELEGQPFTLLAVSVDKRRSDVEYFASQNNLSFPILLDAGETVARSWGTTGLPETYIIDQEGNVAHKIIGPIEYKYILNKIQALLVKK